jgi:hypothetical protein
VLNQSISARQECVGYEHSLRVVRKVLRVLTSTTKWFLGRTLCARRGEEEL